MGVKSNTDSKVQLKETDGKNTEGRKVNPAVAQTPAGGGGHSTPTDSKNKDGQSQKKPLEMEPVPGDPLAKKPSSKVEAINMLLKQCTDMTKEEVEAIQGLMQDEGWRRDQTKTFKGKKSGKNKVPDKVKNAEKAQTESEDDSVDEAYQRSVQDNTDNKEIENDYVAGGHKEPKTIAPETADSDETVERKKSVKAPVSPGPDSTSEGSKDVAGDWKKVYKVKREDINLDEFNISGLFESGDFTDEFKESIQEKFEAGLLYAVNLNLERFMDTYAEALEDAKQEALDELIEKVDPVLDYTVERFMENNEVALTNAIKVERASAFLDDLTKLIESHNINIPVDKEDALEEAERKLLEAQEELNAEIRYTISLKEENENLHRERVIDEVGAGLSDVKKEKLAGLSEGVRFKDVESFKQKVVELKEQFLDEKAGGSVSTDKLSEGIVENKEEKVVTEGNNDRLNKLTRSFVTHRKTR